MEKDDEISGNGNSLTTPFRMYNPRLGRWMSTDPITHPQYSPYSAFDNNPIYYRDPSGADSENGDGDPPRVNGKEGETAANGGKFAANGAVIGGDPNMSEDVNIYADKSEENDSPISDHKWKSWTFDYTVKKNNNSVNSNNTFGSTAVFSNGDSYYNSTINTSSSEVSNIENNFSSFLTYSSAILGDAKFYNQKLINSGKMINLNQLSKGNLTTANLYRSNGYLNGNKYISGKSYLKISKTLAKRAPLVNIASLLNDTRLAFKTGNDGYFVRGLFSTAAGYIPYVGIGASIYISSQPVDNFRNLNPAPIPFTHNSIKSCVVKGTLVKTNGGYEKIELLKSGDSVYTYNFISEEFELNRLSEITRGAVDNYISIELATGDKVMLTIGHPVYIEKNKVIEAKNIIAGNDLYVMKGGFIVKEIVAKVTHIKENVYTFNLRNKNSNFLVTRSALLIKGIE
jgi:RHS repeat-associated protein